MTMIIRLAINAAIAPTDKSICPVTITNVPPTLMIPMNALLVKTLLKLFHDRKLGFNKTPITTSKSSAISGPRVCAHFAMVRQFLAPISLIDARSERHLKGRSNNYRLRFRTVPCR